MKIDLSDVKVGDRVFHPIHHCLAVKIIKCCRIWTVFPGEDDTPDFDVDICGKMFQDDAHPRIFHSSKECAEYFKWVSENE